MRIKEKSNYQPKNIKTLDTEQYSSSDREYMYTVTTTKLDNKLNVTVSGNKFKIAVDTGVTINVIDYNTFEQMKDLKLSHTKTKAFAYSKTTPMESLGKFQAIKETMKRMSVASGVASS